MYGGSFPRNNVRNLVILSWHVSCAGFGEYNMGDSNNNVVVKSVEVPYSCYVDDGIRDTTDGDWVRGVGVGDGMSGDGDDDNPRWAAGYTKSDEMGHLGAKR